MDIGGIGLGGINPKGSEDSKSTEQAKPAQQFNPNAQVSSGIHHSSAQARLAMQNTKSTASADAVINVPTLGMVKVNDKQLQAFADRVRNGILGQEQAMLTAVNTFAGNNKDLRQIVSSALLAI